MEICIAILYMLAGMAEAYWILIGLNMPDEAGAIGFGLVFIGIVKWLNTSFEPFFAEPCPWDTQPTKGGPT